MSAPQGQEARVASADELRDGQMKQVTVGETSVLLVRVEGEFYALGAACPHYGAPLAEGLLDGKRLLCPWHQSVFDVTSGDLLEPPALDALPRFPVRVGNGAVYVRVPAEAPDRRTMPMCPFDAARDRRTFAIIGAGAAGSIAAQTLREESFHGRIALISDDDRAPYDRPNCSKEYLAGEAPGEWMPLRPKSFFEEHGIELMFRRVRQVDVPSRRIEFEDGQTLQADAILLATGGAPRRLEAPGADLPGVLLLRTWADSDAIIAAAEHASKAVIVGGSFIGMEVAASLKHRGIEVTVVARGDTPFQKQLGREVGRIIQQLHEKHGTVFRMGRSVRRILGQGRVEAVELDDGQRLEADLVVAGVGVEPATSILKGVQLNADGSVNVDEYLCVAGGVWAAGDIANYPEPHVGGRARIEHWRLAQQHGRAAARNMVNPPRRFEGVPFFWTRHFGHSFDYVGYASTWDELIMTGNPDELDFSAFYVKNGRLCAMLSTQSAQVNAFAELMRQGRLPWPEDLRRQGAAALDQFLLTR